MNNTAFEEKEERVLLAGVHTGKSDHLTDTTDESIDELEELVKTAGGAVIGSLVQNKSDLEAATYMGEGKLEELREYVHTMNADCVVFDDELSPVQLRNITDYLGVKVLDRSMLILDIFAMRAKSGEGKLQVELAQLKYRLPRLRGMGEVLSRTGAGIGTRGPGETKLETDRRHIHRRITSLTEQLADVKKHRELIRSRREKDGVITAALVGYTNAGKSSVLNRLTNAGVTAENKLFATLDPTSRQIVLPDNRRIMIVDTVGFIRKLPHHLVESFKSTLEEAVVADVLLHIVDASNSQRENQIKVVNSVLADIGASGKSVVGVLNKCDLVGSDADSPAAVEGADICVRISAKTGEGTDTLLNALGEAAPGKKQEMTICIPYSEGSLVSSLHETEKVICENYTEKGTKMTLLADARLYDRLRGYICGE